MCLINLNENKDKFFRLNIAKDQIIEFSKDIEFDKTSQNKKYSNQKSNDLVKNDE
jgi:hypothetical protein